MTKTLIMRSCRKDMTSTGGFVWPASGEVVAPDWNPEPKCGGGLHGLLPGQNNPGVWYDEDGSKILLVEVDEEDLVILDSKVKFRAGVVVYCGDMAGACSYTACRGCGGPWYRGTATAGDYGTATAGHCGTATAGNDGTATVGNDGTATVGDYGTATTGNYGTATTGHDGTIVIAYSDGERRRLAVGYVGEDGILPHVAYRVVDGKLVPQGD